MLLVLFMTSVRVRFAVLAPEENVGNYSNPIWLKPEKCATDGQIVSLLTSTYNKNKIPGDGVEIEVEVWVQEITAISDITSDVHLDIYLSELWLDPALNYEKFNPCKQNLSLNYEFLRRIWTPNTCFVNSKFAHIHDSPFRNIFFMLYPNGTVWVNYRMRLIGPCLLDLTSFPFDSFKCHLTYESFNYNTDEVRMKWSLLGAKPMREKMEIADYQLINITTDRVTEVKTPPVSFA